MNKQIKQVKESEKFANSLIFFLTLLRIYLSFLKPYLDYCNIVIHQSRNDPFIRKIKAVLYNAAFNITEAVREFSKDNLIKIWVLNLPSFEDGEGAYIISTK